MSSRPRKPTRLVGSVSGLEILTVVEIGVDGHWNGTRWPSAVCKALGGEGYLPHLERLRARPLHHEKATVVT